MKKNLIAILGPTGIGKTALSIELAEQLATVIISADSRQFYQEMSIGTAKPTLEEIKGIEHHFINSLGVNENYNAGKFEEDCLKLLNTLWAKHSSILMVGGSGLYIDAVCKGFNEIPSRNEGLRKELTEQFQSQGLLPLQNRLAKLDPECFKQIDLNNPHRVIRALEVILTSGKSILELKKPPLKKRDFQSIKIGLNTNRELLYERINSRVDQMMKDGLLEEVKKLVRFRDLQALQTVGYQELFQFLDGNLSLEDAIELIKRNSRRYAKRQLTWFNRDKDIHWFDPENRETIIDFVQNKIKA